MATQLILDPSELFDAEKGTIFGSRYKTTADKGFKKNTVMANNNLSGDYSKTGDLFLHYHISNYKMQLLSQVVDLKNYREVDRNLTKIIGNITLTPAYSLDRVAGLEIYNYTGGTIMKGITCNAQNYRVHSYFNFFMKIFASVLITLLGISFFDFAFLPREAALIGAFLFSGGIIGLYIDRTHWSNCK